MNETDKLIEEQLKTLPLELQQAIESVPWKNLVQEIGKQNNLTKEQVSSLEQETMLIIYGFENPTDYSANLVREVGLDQTAAENLASAVWDKILGPISQKVEVKESGIPEIPSVNLPVVEPPFAQDTIMVKKGEVAHEVPHAEPTTSNQRPTTEKPKISVSAPDYRYPENKDPYREPLA